MVERESRQKHAYVITIRSIRHPGINAASAFTNPDKERAAATISRGVSAYKHRREPGESVRHRAPSPPPPPPRRLTILACLSPRLTLNGRNLLVSISTVRATREIFTRDANVIREACTRKH